MIYFSERMAGIVEGGVGTTLKLCSGGGELCCFGKTEKQYFARRVLLQETQQLNYLINIPLDNGTVVNINIFTREDSVLEQNTLITMNMANGSRVQQTNCTGVQLNLTTSLELSNVTLIELKNSSTVQLFNGFKVNLNDGTMIQQNNLTMGQLNSGTTVEWNSSIQHWYNHATEQWCNGGTKELVIDGDVHELSYTETMVQGRNATKVQW